jgi:pyruvate dehydrogenase E2 component (dihydrolipoamide acetyltransferase)
MAEIVMPRLSDTMEEGTILRWLKRDGEHVSRGEELVEIETDKAAMVYESDEEGTLRIVAAEGDTLAVGATIAQLDAAKPSDTAAATDQQPAETERQPASGQQPDGSGTADRQPAAAQQRATQTDQPEQSSEPEQSSKPEQSSEPEQSSKPEPAGQQPPTAATGASQHAAAAASEGERVKASPVAKRVAHERGIDLHGLEGSGPGGRIVKADVETAVAAATAPARPTQPASPALQPSAGSTPVAPATPETLAERVATAKGETTIVELTRTQQTIARRMAESKATIPDFALQMEIDMEACVALRGELKRLSPEQAPTYNDMIVKACALALREHPRANGSYRDGRLQLHSRVNVGVAVAVASGKSTDGTPATSGDTGDALLVPTVFDADLKALGEIARETRTLAERVRAGTISPPELGGGTFTVSNLGMYGVRGFTAIVNPPQAGILSVGSLAPRPVVHDGEIVARHTLAVTLACDHRILYGADAAGFLARIRELLEEPAALTL